MPQFLDDATSPWVTDDELGEAIDGIVVDPAVDQGGFRTLGTGATQAAAGDHEHVLAPIGTRFATSQYICSGPGSTTTGAANRLYTAMVPVLSPCTLTGIAYSAGGTSAGSVHVALYDDEGNQVAASTGTISMSTINVPHSVPFSSPYEVAEAGAFGLAIVFDNATATFFGARQLTLTATTNSAFPPPSSITAPSAIGSVTFPLMTTY